MRRTSVQTTGRATAARGSRATCWPPRRTGGLRMWVVLACVAFAFGAVGGAWSGPLIGGTIAYVQGTEAYEIYVVDAGIGRLRRVWREEDDRITSVKLSPDGQRVAFEAGTGRRGELYIVNVDGTGPRKSRTSIGPSHRAGRHGHRTARSSHSAPKTRSGKCGAGGARWM